MGYFGYNIFKYFVYLHVNVLAYVLGLINQPLIVNS